MSTPGNDSPSASRPDFARIVEEHASGLYRFAYSLAGNPADASDLVQQTFLTWAEKGGALREPGKVKSWLFTTLYREFLRTRRRARIVPMEPMTDSPVDYPDAPVDLAARLDAQILVEKLQELDPVYRAPITLFYLEDLSYKEIASLLEVPIGTVLSRLSRAKQQLKELMSHPSSPPSA